jgi:hypothetical protein
MANILLAEIWGSHSCGHEEYYLLAYDAMQSGTSLPVFQEHTAPILNVKQRAMLLPAWSGFKQSYFPQVVQILSLPPESSCLHQ